MRNLKYNMPKSLNNKFQQNNMKTPPLLLKIKKANKNRNRRKLTPLPRKKLNKMIILNYEKIKDPWKTLLK